MSRPLTRHEARPPAASARLNRVIVVVLLALEAYVALSVLIRPGGSKPEFNFKSEHGSITLLSSTMFLVGAVIAARTLRTVWWAGVKSRLMWAGLTAVLLYFSVDEVVGFHEAAGDVMDADVGAGPFRTWNDLVVLAYGLVALPAALIFWREILRYERLLTMFVISGVLFVSTSMVDTLSTTPTTASVILEEGIKIHCSTFLMLSALTGLYAARKLTAASESRAAAAAAPDDAQAPMPAQAPAGFDSGYGSGSGFDADFDADFDARYDAGYDARFDSGNRSGYESGSGGYSNR